MPENKRMTTRLKELFERPTLAPFQLRVRTLYPRTQPVPSTPLSI